MAGDFLDALDALSSQFLGGGSGNAGRDLRSQSVALTNRYFAEVRPQLVSVLGETAKVVALDKRWQGFVRLAHTKRQIIAYLAALRSLREGVIDLTVACLGRKPAPPENVLVLSREETLLIKTLASLSPSAEASYRQGLIDLADKNRVSYRGTASEFRECLREVMDQLAPDADVMAQDGFKLDDKQTKPTTRQKVKYILKKRDRSSAQRDATEKSMDLIDELSGAVARAVQSRASAAAHVAQTPQEVARVKRYIDVVLFDVLEVT